MNLVQFKDLIGSMPTAHHAFEAQLDTWLTHIDNAGPASNALVSRFGNGETTFTSRTNLRQLAAQGRIEEFVVATILWGYPQGMRGSNFREMMNSLGALGEILRAARANGITDWPGHYSLVKPIRGLGLSTYSKFLCFLDVSVHGQRALILDDRIIRIAQAQVFDELQPLASLSKYTAVARYPAYLECMHQVSERLQVPAENLEFFLFEFGLNLK